MVLRVLLALPSLVVPALGECVFYYSTYYLSLRIGGLIFAVVLCLLGIILVASRKCSCKKKDKSR
uniref:FXYD domain-containing ion transport regulator n=1 Tax=Cynoglossus semilaevis TaxID=244447 RepID=A0A3P8VBW6_CYNSE